MPMWRATCRRILCSLAQPTVFLYLWSLLGPGCVVVYLVALPLAFISLSLCQSCVARRQTASQTHCFHVQGAPLGHIYMHMCGTTVQPLLSHDTIARLHSGNNEQYPLVLCALQSFAFALPPSTRVAPAAERTVALRSWTLVVKMTLSPSFHISVTSVSPG